MIKFLLYLWQLPQNLLGLFLLLYDNGFNINVIKFCRDIYDNIVYYHSSTGGAVSLGNYIIIDSGNWIDPPYMKTIHHERGHQKQSLYLGPLYLLIIGIPSLTGNLIDRYCHKDWDYDKAEKWYYSLPWEKWADKLGDVNR